MIQQWQQTLRISILPPWRQTYYYRGVWEFLSGGRAKGRLLREKGLGVWRAKQAAMRAERMELPYGLYAVVFVNKRTGEAYCVSRSSNGKMSLSRQDPDQSIGGHYLVACTGRAAGK
jgi:hypothetical protein